MIVNCCRKVLLVFESPTLRQLCFNFPEEVPDELCHSLSVDLSITTWTQRGLINKHSGNAFGAVTRIRSIIIITFGTTNVVVHSGITFSAGISVGTSIGAQNKYYILVAVVNNSITFLQKEKVPCQYSVTLGSLIGGLNVRVRLFGCQSSVIVSRYS